MARDIDISEDYQRIYKAFENINFASADFNSIKQSLIDNLRLNFGEHFDDWIESSEIISLISAFAYMGEQLMYRIDMNTHENFISQANRKESILRLARLIAYAATRRDSSRGLVRIESISTSESVRDSRGIDLGNRVIKWNDSSNVNWQEQFFTVMGLILKQRFGTPIKGLTTGDVSYELYGTRVDNLTNGVYPYSVRTSQQNLRMELVSGALTSIGTAEEVPDLNAEFRLFYRNDNLGLGSVGTGFMMQTVQGELIRSIYDFDQPIPNRKVILPHNGINNTDIHVIELESVDSDTQIDTWNRVDSLRGENLYFNPTEQRKNYEAISLDNDGVELHFGDSAFATIPIGPFNVWSRTSEADPIVVPRAIFQEKEFSFSYNDKDGNAQTASLRFSLMNTLNNASPSEDIERIRSVAPSTYYTQDRMVNSRDYNEFLFQDPSVLKLKAVNRTFSGASKYQRFQDASGNYQNIKIFGDDLRVYIDDGYDSRVYSRGEGATELQLIDTILEDVLYNNSVQDHLRIIQGVTSPRIKFREEVNNTLTYTGIGIDASIDTSYPLPGHNQEKTELQGRIDGKYYGAFGTTATPVDGLVHLDQNSNVYILDFEIPGESRFLGVQLSDIITGVEVLGLSTGATGSVQSLYPVTSQDPISAVYGGYDATYDFTNNDIDTGIGSLYINGSSATGVVIDLDTLETNVPTNTFVASVELRLGDEIATHTNSTDTWFFTGADVADGDIYLNNVLFTGFTQTAPTDIDINNSAAPSGSVVELRYDVQTGGAQGASGDGTWIERWTFIGSPKSVLEGTVYINGAPAVAGVDYILPVPFTPNEIWTQFVPPATVELIFDDVVGVHQNHIAQWSFNTITLGINTSAAEIYLDGNLLLPTSYTILSSSTIELDATAAQSLTVQYVPNTGTFISGIDRWNITGTTFDVPTNFAELWVDGSWVDINTTPYTVTQLTASTARIAINANPTNITTMSLQWNEVAKMIIETSSTNAVLSFDDAELLEFSTTTGNLNVNNGVGGKLLSTGNTLFTYKIQDGSGGGIGGESLGLHVAGINSGSTSNDVFGIGYDRLLDQYYTIAPQDIGTEDAKFSREFNRNKTGFNLDDSWLVRVKPIRSGGETEYLVGHREAALVARGITKDYYYQNGRSIQDGQTGLLIEDTFTVLGTNPDIKDEHHIGENVLFPVVRQPINEITGKQERKSVVIKEFDTNQDGVPDDRDAFSQVVDLHSPTIIMALDGRYNDLSEGEFQVARDASSVYGPKPSIFDFGETSINWQEVVNYYGLGSFTVSGPFNLTYSDTNGGSKPTLSGASSVVAGGLVYNLPTGDVLTGEYDVYFDGRELPSHVYALTSTEFHIAFESFMGYLTPLGTESLELRPSGIKTKINDSLQLTSTETVTEPTDFTIETIIRLDNMESITLFDGFHLGGFPLSSIENQLTDVGFRLDITATVTGDVANKIEFTVGDGVLSDPLTYITPSTTLSHTLETDPTILRRLPHDLDFNDKQFHHIALTRTTVIEYNAFDLNDFVNTIKIGDKITDANGSTALVWDLSDFDVSGPNGFGILWLYDVNLVVPATSFGLPTESLVVNSLRLDGTFGDVVSTGLVMNDSAYRALKFFVDGVGSDIINLTQNYPTTVDFNAVPDVFFPDVTMLSNRKSRTVGDIPVGEQAIVYCEGLTISQEARYGEDFNDTNNVYQKYPRIFPQSVFFQRPDTLSDFIPLLTVPTPTVINNDIASFTPDKRLYQEFIGRDAMHYLWTHYSPRFNLIDPSKTNIIDIFVHTFGYQRELEQWLERGDILEPQPQPPSSLDLKTAYDRYLTKAMLSDTTIMHSGRIKYLFGVQAVPELRAKFRVIKREDTTTSDEQLKSLTLDVINSFFDITHWDFGRPFYFTELASAIHNQLPNDVQSVVLVPSAGVSRFGDLFQVSPESDEILQSAAKLTDVEIIAGITRQNIRRSDD